MPENQGMFDAFPGHRLPSQHDLDNALRSALVVVDANVMLNLYRYAESTRADLLAVLSRLGDRLWVPHQAIKEFWRHRLGVLTTPNNAAVTALGALGKPQKSIEDAVGQWAKMTGVADTMRDELLGKVRALHDELRRAIGVTAPEVPRTAEQIRSEPVLRELEPLLAGRIGPRPEPGDEKAWIAEGNRRVDAQEPPGYCDADKIESDLPERAAGDYLVWRSAITEAARRDLDLLLVTADEKEDWWLRHRDQFLGPRIELVEEFRALCGRRLFMLRPAGLLERASVLEISVRRESLADVARVTEVRDPDDDPGTALWTSDGVLALLSRLDAEGVPHGVIIRAAAREGGSVSRDDVYRLAGFEANRMLRGFTRPTARITQELQALGVVADGVEPALTPIYDGMKATAFVIPLEMVAILAEDDQR
ncbi:MAG TPA: PIN-like domain-containing protein [Pseudonocardiaceae bacterium]|nr:PIN-like domain-containing protein [Pseudonocardiaceae bacterium]